jgi:outer membrane receptor for ferrienterochelin and colicins
MGGVLDFENALRGSDQIYGKSIFTNRFELLGHYDLPVQEKISFMYSFNSHHQDSYYGDTYYLSNTSALDKYFETNKFLQKPNMMAGVAFRYTLYDDNSPATASPDNLDQNQPSIIYLPGIFVQNETKFNTKHSLVWAGRYDYNSAHGSLLTPRLAYKFSPNEDNIWRFNLGKGFRIVNLFTEDHAALTGARQVVIASDLKPEQS